MAAADSDPLAGHGQDMADPTQPEDQRILSSLRAALVVEVRDKTRKLPFSITCNQAITAHSLSLSLRLLGKRVDLVA